MSHNTLETFLQNKNTTLEQVSQNMQNKVKIYDDDIVLVVGSLVEGMGNTKSDLDLLLITDREPSLLPESEHVVWIEGKCLVDIRVVEFQKIDQLLNKFDQWSKQSWELMHVADFNLDDRNLLHRMINCVDISPANNQRIQQLTLPDRNHLSKLKLNLARHNTRTILVDMMGHKETHDYHSLVFAAHVVLNRAIDALLAAHLNTNPLDKWRARFLQNLTTTKQYDFLGTPTDSNAATMIWKLFSTPQNINQDSAIPYALKVVTFARKIFLWAENKLFEYQLPIFSGTETDTAQQDRMPYLDFYTDFIITKDGIFISLLNEFIEPYQLNDNELNMALMCDGHRSLNSAAEIIANNNNHQTKISAVQNFLDLLKQKGFLHDKFD